MAKKAAKKVRSIEISKVKNGKGGSLHKVTAHFHHSPGKAGKGMSASFPSYHDPEETYHTTPGAMRKHVGGLIGQMTTGAEDEPEQGAYPENDRDEDVS